MAEPRLVELADVDVQNAPSPEETTTTEVMRNLTNRLARAPQSWGTDDAALVAQRFDERAASWSTRDTPESRFPLRDALARGEVAGSGLCLEIGCGTGIQTPALREHFDEVLSVDLSFEMLAHAWARPGLWCNADASALPVADGRAAVVVCVNAFLFAPEYLRALSRPAVVVFVSTRAERTPIYLPPAEVLDALCATGVDFHATTARAGTGCWTVARSDA